MIELLEQQKKLTSNQWKLICTANVADLLDFFDFFLIGYVTAALTKEWSLAYWQGGAILLASGLGAVPGAFIWGWLGDRIGRRTVFMWSAVTISLATGIMVFTPGPSAVIPGWLFLMFFRVFVGVGNAGIFTIDLPLVQEFIPAYKRGWVSALVTTLLPGGGMLAGLVASWLLPIVGWRYLFLVGLSPLVLVFMIRYWVPELPRWLIRMGRLEEARRSLAWAPPRRRHSSLCDGGAAYCICGLPPQRLYRRLVAVLCAVDRGRLFQQCDLLGRRAVHGGDLARPAALQRHGHELWHRQSQRQGVGAGRLGGDHGGRRHHQAGSAEL